ncbi:hypothetical protein HHK36_002234 [Tetracentron sinense]|uniref:DYW domain-containing protein n=1 Tax=Tetracentron sinense TaxID=13715 RepID=A0A834ZV27_TETSI|nr:hypothetical protein HHK36_002234 [Tetracentron sinense]
MRLSALLLTPHTRTMEQKTMSLLQDSTKLHHLLQIHAFIIKTSLDRNNFVLAKFLGRIFSCSSSRNLPYARSLFDRIPSPDTFIWNTMIRAYLNAQKPQESVSLFFQMWLRDGIAVDSFSLSLVLQACGRSFDNRNGQSIHTQVLKLGFGSDLFVQTALIEMYAKFGIVDNSRKTLDEMNEPDIVSYNVLLAEYVRVGEIDSARKLFDTMPDRDLVSWNTMIHGYATHGDVGAARELFDITNERDLVSWSSMIAAYAKTRQSNEALRLFHEMQLANLMPDSVTMASVVSACGDVGALGMGKMIHEYIERNRIEIDMKLGTSLVDMYAKCGDIDLSLRVFGKMDNRDVFTWSAMIIGLANHGYGEVALDHFSVMISEKIKPNDITFIGVLSACSHVGLVDKGWTYFSSMSDVYGVTPKIEHYGCMVDVLSRAGRLQEARKLIRNMPFAPDAIVWRALLGACRIYKNVELAEEAVVNLLELEPQVDGNYVLLSNIYSQAKRWEEVVNVRRVMRGRSIQKVPGSSSVEIDNAVHEFVAGDKSHRKSKEIYQMLAEMTDRLNHAGYKPLTASVLQDLNNEAKERALAHHSEKLAIAFSLLSTTPGSVIRIVKNLRHYLPHKSHFSLLESCKNPKELRQIHTLSIKTGIFDHISVSSRLLALYSDPKIGNLEYARSVFDRIQEPNSFSWNTIIKCYVQNHHSDYAIILFCEMLRESAVPPDNFTLPCIIKACARICAIEEGKQIHGMILKGSFSSDIYVQSSLVSLYSKGSEINSAQRVFDGMADRDLVSWNSLIDGYAKCGEIKLAQQVFDQMPQRDSFSWTVLIDGYSKCGKVKTAYKFFDQMPKKNLVSWNAMINGFMKSGDIESAHSLFSRMRTRNIITWNSMIAGYEGNGQFMEALELFQTMLKVGPMPNYATLVSALSAVSGLALLDQGRWIHSYMDRNEFNIDGVLGTSLIEMYSKCGTIESALTVFRAIPRRKLGHWTAIIVGLGMHGMADHAIESLVEMQKLGMKPHAITFIGVLNACSHAGMVDEGRQYFELMRNEYGIKPTIEHYGCLVDLMCRSGHLEEARNVIKNMPMKPNKVIWMSLLSGSRNYGNIEIGEYAAKHVIELAPEAIGCYVLLSNIYAAAGRWDNVSKVREMMKERGVKKDPGCSFVEHKGLLHEFVVGDRLHPQTEEIYSKLKEMEQRLKYAGYIPDTTQVLLYIDGEKEKEAELAKHSERLAIAFGLINVESGRPLRIVKNLRVCNDCHSVTKLLSDIYNREIIVRDNNRFHHFKKGSCSCMDYW